MRLSIILLTFFLVTAMQLFNKQASIVLDETATDTMASVYDELDDTDDNFHSPLLFAETMPISESAIKFFSDTAMVSLYIKPTAYISKDHSANAPPFLKA